MIFNLKFSKDALTLGGKTAEEFADADHGHTADEVGALSNSGGTINGDIEVKKAGSELATFTIANALRRLGFRVGADGGSSFYDYTNEKTVFVMLDTGKNIFNGTASGNLPLTGGNVDALTVAYNTVLHTGNSAKVVINETAPSDTSSLWVW